MSLLVRVSRNCPWNRCAFCPVYKGAKYSKRTVAEVHADLDALAEVHGDSPRTVFLQDADPLLTRPDDLVAIVTGVRERFPNVRRITTYARSRTLARRTHEELTAIREAGLDRVHVGLESGSDRVLELIRKGVTRADQIDAGRKARAAGFELSEYVMPGVGGRALSDEHADETASAIAAIEPDFVRLRTTAVAPGSPLAEMEEAGDWEPLGEVEAVAEIRRFLGGLEGVTTRIESDHSLNLMMELRGDLPDQWADLVDLLDRFLALPEEDRDLFVLGRRLGYIQRLSHFDRADVREGLGKMMGELESRGLDPESVFAELRRRMV
jgi:radical SAM superfamily enzyme YgiQ (UPF0313 family)